MHQSYKLTPQDQSIVGSIRSLITDWFVTNGRVFPWRNSSATVYERIVTEVLLQRTRAASVASIYHSFFDHFPNWISIHLSSSESIQDSLKPIGIWRRRSASLKLLSSEMVERNGVYPDKREDIDNLPGVGQYVGNAIELFAHNRAMPLLDANMARVMERVIRPRELSDIRHDPWLQEICTELVQSNNSVDINWAILDIGGLLCRPSKPECGSCPLSSLCNYHQGLIAGKGAGFRQRLSGRSQ